MGCLEIEDSVICQDRPQRWYSDLVCYLGSCFHDNLHVAISAHECCRVCLLKWSVTFQAMYLIERQAASHQAAQNLQHSLGK